MSHRHCPILGKTYSRALFAAFLLLADVCKGQPVVTVATTNPTCAYNNGSFIVTVTGDTPPYSFVSNAARENNSTGIFGELAAGTYDLTVRDIKGKQTTTSVVLTDPGAFPYFTSAVVNATGCNTNNGQVTLMPAGGTPPYQYSINDGASFQPGNVFSNLGPGSYSILIEDANGCVTAPWSAVGVSYANFQLWSQAKFVNVSAPNCPVVISAMPSAPACGNKNSITITNTTGGTTPYVYSIDGAGFGPLVGGGFSNLPPGGHTVTVKDATGLTSSYSYTFPNDCPITTTQTNAQCGTNTGSLTVAGGSGIPPLSYSMDGTNFQASPTFNNLPAGSYTILVKDAYGVVTYGSGNVAQICFGALATSTSSQCDMSTGTITAGGVNGFPPYSYSIDGVNFQASPVFPNLKGGYYTLTVTDNNGQTAKKTVVVADQCITLVATPQPAACGNPTGSLTITASNGTALPYQYSRFGGSGYQPSNVFTGLAAGNYTVTVMDANGNLATVGATVLNTPGPQLAAIPTTATCVNNDGTISIVTAGGTAPFTGSIDGGAYNSQTSWTGVDSGTHSIAITDANGCKASTTVLVPLTDTLTVTAGTVPATCVGVGDTLPVTSNIAGASFAWTPADSLSSSTVANPVATPSATTTYSVTATLGVCAKTVSVPVTVLPAPVAVAGASDTICPGKSIQLQGSGGIGYQWSPATYLSDSTSADPTVEQPASTITYDLKVTGANGCSSVNPAAMTVVVTQPKVFAGDDTAVVIGQPLQLNAVDVDTSGFTSYIWSPAQGLSDPNIRDPTTVVAGDITYTVVATTLSGCSATGKIVIGAATTAGILVPNAFTPNNDGHNDILKVNAFGIQSLKYFRVYSRWGQLVFASFDAGAGWDGSIGGQPAATGAYVWMAAGVDYLGRPVEGRGTVILIR